MGWPCALREFVCSIIKIFEITRSFGPESGSGSVVLFVTLGKSGAYRAWQNLKNPLHIFCKGFLLLEAKFYLIFRYTYLSDSENIYVKEKDSDFYYTQKNK